MGLLGLDWVASLHKSPPPEALPTKQWPDLRNQPVGKPGEIYNFYSSIADWLTCTHVLFRVLLWVWVAFLIFVYMKCAGKTAGEEKFWSCNWGMVWNRTGLYSCHDVRNFWEQNDFISSLFFTEQMKNLELRLLICRWQLHLWTLSAAPLCSPS